MGLAPHTPLPKSRAITDGCVDSGLAHGKQLRLLKHAGRMIAQWQLMSSEFWFDCEWLSPINLISFPRKRHERELGRAFVDGQLKTNVD